ncbi:hypothetical protein EG68_06225 [Paragonimus skrjabini miyazakii]|uniref:C2H2-type domain-containing protein n=1 Tax=Paragonimus skrjabini miyazakii TaxID=59628 RepID=A0A8S9YUX1_9TREM|nr:hypothetical protein EG68_06225 [Paragonimus skrjabini miyazakii]
MTTCDPGKCSIPPPFIMDSASKYPSHSTHSPILSPPLMIGVDESQNQKELFTCNTCNVMCSGRIPYEQHIGGAQHRQLNASVFECSVCNVSMNSKHNYEAHITGAKHKRKTELASISPVKAPVETKEQTPPAIALPPATEPTVISEEQLKCIACDLVCSSSDQLAAHLNGKKHAKRCKQQASLLVESTVRSQADSAVKPDALAADQQPRGPRSSRKRALISYTKSQTEGGINRLCELEALTTVEFMTPTLLLLPSCIQRKVMNDVDGPELAGKRKALDTDAEVSDRPFCTHLKCMFTRALKYYELGLEKLHGDRNGDLVSGEQDKTEVLNTGRAPV